MTDLTEVLGQGKRRDEDEWDDRGGYMKVKVRKLDKQFEHIESKDGQQGILPDLFNGVVIFVNGYTIPSLDELKKLMKKHGGGFQHYYLKAKCTHIIATNLPDSKIKELRDEKVVHPNWILDSIKNGKLLPYRKYLLYGTGGKYKDSCRPKGSVMNFIGTDVASSTEDTGVGASSCEVKTENDMCPCDEDTSCNTEGDACEVHTTSDSLSKSSSKNENISYTSAEHLVTHDTNTASETIVQPMRGDQHRTALPKAGDPNFVKDYYSNSRLHYLSTWGAEFKDFINNLIATTELKDAKRSPSKMSSKKCVIMHVDMDSFFVSVTLRNRPDLKGKPVAVSHAGRGPGTKSAAGADTSLSFASTSEIASCSYEARSCGVRNGMWLGEARKLCPQLICVPYQFKEYREVSQQLYTILASYTHEIQAVSCDEAFMDVTSCVEEEHVTPLQLAQRIRDEILSETKCPASAGIGPNILLARMSTKVAKPNGQFYLQPDEVPEFIGKQKVSDLPGVGYSLNQKLKALNVSTCYDLQRIPLYVLRKEFGRKTGEMLYNYCRGEDDRQLKIERERKSVSAEINYAIRFQEDSEPEKFISDLSREVQRRLKSIGVKGRHLTLKLKVRQKDAPINPTKFMGCGRCDNHSRSVTMETFTDDASVIAKECNMMLRLLGVAVSDIRGMGIQLSKLSKDGRTSSSSSSSMATKTIHDFMKPRTDSKKTNNSVSCALDSGTHSSHGKTVEPGIPDSNLSSGSVDQVTRFNDQVTDRDDTITRHCEYVTSSNEAVMRNDENLTRNAEVIPNYTESFARNTDMITTNSGALTNNDEDLTTNVDEFSLVLSEDELEENGFEMGQRNMNESESRNSHQSTALRINHPSTTNTISSKSETRRDFPPLPVFPVFSPPRRISPTSFKNQSTGRNNYKASGLANSTSPGRASRGSPGRANQRSPKRANQGSPGRANQESLGRANQRSPGAQRSLLASFRSPKVSEVATTLSLPSPSQIDPAVFEALPDEIKKDIEQSYQQRNQKFSLRNCTAESIVDNHTNRLTVIDESSEIDQAVFEALPDEIKKDIVQSYRDRNMRFPLRNNNTEINTENQADKNTFLNEANQIDQEVFECLPHEIKRDIEQSFQNRNLRDPFNKGVGNVTENRTDKSNVLNEANQIDRNVFEALPEEIKRVVSNANPRTGIVKKRNEKDKKALKQKSLAKKRTIKSYVSTKTVPAEVSLSALSTTQRANTVLPLDPSVMDAMPESLRHEVQMAYEQQRRHDEKEKTKQENTFMTATSVAMESTSAYDDNITMATPAKPKVSLAGAETLSDIRKMLKLWVTTTTVPLDQDVGILVEFLANLVSEKDLEKMSIVMKFFRGLVSDLKAWHLSFNTVLANVQEILQENYGSQLALDCFNTEVKPHEEYPCF